MCRHPDVQTYIFHTLWNIRCRIIECTLTKQFFKAGGGSVHPFQRSPDVKKEGARFDSLVSLFMCQVCGPGWALRFWIDFVAVPGLESGLGTWSPNESKVVALQGISQLAHGVFKNQRWRP